jgi:hypothetical protein
LGSKHQFDEKLSSQWYVLNDHLPVENEESALASLAGFSFMTLALFYAPSTVYGLFDGWCPKELFDPRVGSADCVVFKHGLMHENACA